MSQFLDRDSRPRVRLVKKTQFGLLALSLAVLAGCGTLDPMRDADYHAEAPTTDRPVVRPVRSISSFSESLVCMDHLLRAAEVPTTLITSAQFPDYSGKVPVAVKSMVVTALSQMSHVSNAFRYVDFEVDIARQDTVQNLTTILLNNNQMQLQRPALYVNGAITYVDQNVLGNQVSAGTSANRLDTGYSRSKSSTVVALEAHLGDFRTRTFIPGLDSANEVVIGGAGEGLDLAGRIGSYGVRFNVGRNYAQGAGGAMRTLVDLAMIELVGKWARVPYWQCLMLEQTNPAFQRQMREWFDASGPNGQSGLIQNSLVHQGYLPPAGTSLPLNHPLLRRALAQFQADKGLVVTGRPDFATYERALRNFVALDENGALTRIGWTSSGAVVASAGDGSAKPADWGLPAPWAINLQIENPQPANERAPFKQGEQVFLSAVVSRNSYLYCYFTGSDGGTMRLLPNAMSPDAQVSADQAVRMPDWMAPNPAFILDAGKPGTEGVTCLATRDDASTRLPQLVQGPALTTIANVRSADDLQRAFGNALGTSEFVAQTIQWKVVPASNGNGNGNGGTARK